MKKYPFFFLFLLLSYSTLTAQDYQNIVTNGLAFYSDSTNATVFLSGIKIESKSSMGSGDTLFLAANTIRPHTSGTLLDTVGGILGRIIIKRNNGWFSFVNATGDTIFLNSQAVLNESWKFCSLPAKGQLVATCSSIHSISLLGINETVKEITFHARDSNGVNIPNYYNAKSIQLGQHYGFTRIYDLFHIPDTSGVFKLEGKNNPAIGFQGMTWHDVYNYEVGDEFQIVGLTNYLWGSHPATIDYTIIRKVLAKQVASGQENVTYTFESCKEVIDYNPLLGPTTSYTHDTIQLSYPYSSSLADSSINWLPEQFAHSDYRYYSSLHHLVPGIPAYGHSGNYYLCCWGLNYYFNLYINNDREYAKGLGQVHYKTYWTYFDLIKYDYEDLVYYKKGNEHWGNPVYVNCSAMMPYCTSYPDTLILDRQAGSTDTLFITSNKSWRIINPFNIQWAGYNKTEGSGNATVLFSANSENADSTVRIAFFGIESSAGNISLYVQQSGKTSGIEGKFAGNIKISPNPMKETAILSFPGLSVNQEKQLTIFDVTGRLVFEDYFSGEMYRLNRGSLSSGIYLLKVHYRNDKPPSMVKVVLE